MCVGRMCVSVCVLRLISVLCDLGQSLSSLSLAHTHNTPHTHTHTTRTRTRTRTRTPTNTRVGFYGLRGFSIGCNGFYTPYPTPKLSPHRRRCIYIFPQKKLTLYDL